MPACLQEGDTVFAEHGGAVLQVQYAPDLDFEALGRTPGRGMTDRRSPGMTPSRMSPSREAPHRHSHHAYIIALTVCMHTVAHMEQISSTYANFRLAPGNWHCTTLTLHSNGPQCCPSAAEIVLSLPLCMNATLS